MIYRYCQNIKNSEAFPQANQDWHQRSAQLWYWLQQYKTWNLLQKAPKFIQQISLSPSFKVGPTIEFEIRAFANNIFAQWEQEQRQHRAVQI